MTNPFTDKNISREKLRRIIENARKHVEPLDQDIECQEYDWTEPHRFTPEHLVNIDSFARKLCNKITRTFVSLCQGEFETKIDTITQHFACKLADSTPVEKEGYYFLPFTLDDEEEPRRCGIISFSQPTALALVSHMLRETDNEPEEGKVLSQLEESILMDIVAAVVDALAEAFKDNGGPEILRAPHFIKSDWAMDYDGLQDTLTIDFTVDNPQGEVKASFTMLSDIIDQVLGIQYSSTPRLPQKEMAEIIMHRMHEAPIRVTAQICHGSIRLRDVIDLKKGDVMLLHKKITHPIELLLNEQPCLKAYPAQCQGKYALVVAEEDDKIM